MEQIARASADYRFPRPKFRSDWPGDRMDRFIANYGEHYLARILHRADGLNGRVPENRDSVPVPERKQYAETLKFIADNPGCTTRQVAEATGVVMATVRTRLVHLRERGHVTSRRDEGQSLRPKVWNVTGAERAGGSDMLERESYRGVVKILRERGEATSREISDALGISRDTANTRLCRLRTAGHVSGVRDTSLPGEPLVWSLVGDEA